MPRSRRVGRRGRLASRALSAVSSGRSAEKLTSSSGLPATARTAAPMAVLKTAVVSGLFGLRGAVAMELCGHRQVRSALGQILAEHALVELGHHGALELVTLVEEG